MEIDFSNSPNIYVEVLCTTALPCFEKKKKIEAAASVRFSRLPTASQPQCPHLVVPPPAQRMAPPAGVRSSTPCCLGGCWPSKQKKGCEKAEAAASTHGTTTKLHQARRHQQCPSLALGAVALLWHNSEERRAALAPSALLVLTLMVVASASALKRAPRRATARPLQ